MRVRGSLLVAVLFLAVGIYGLVESLSFEYWESTALPAFVSGVIILMSAIEIGKELFRNGDGVTTEGAKLHRNIITVIEARRLGLITGWVAAFTLCIYLFGFRIAIPLFAFLYLKWRGRHWAACAAFAVFILAFVYGAFELGLNAILFDGIVFGDR